MLWFFDRNHQHVQVETRYDTGTNALVVIVRWPDLPEQRERFESADACKAWLLQLESALAAGRWTPRGSPVILPHGWPDASGLWKL